MWKDHPVYVGYRANQLGEVWSVDRSVPSRNRWGSVTRRIKGVRLRTFPNKDGYLGGNISIAGVRVNFETHRFVCEAFHGLPQGDGLEVRHLDGNKANCRPDNLAWGTQQEQHDDRRRHGTGADTMKRDDHGRFRPA